MPTFQDLLTFTRGSTATYVNRLGLIATEAVDEPRFQHDPTTLTTSSTTINLDSLAAGDSVLIDLPGSDTFAVGKDISVTDSSNINRYLTAVVEFSNPGSVQVTVKTINGTGSGSSWTLIENLGLLIEEQRTNLLLWSEDFTNAAWTKTLAVSSSSVESPDGLSNYYKIVTAAGEAYRTVSQVFSAPDNSVVVLSCYFSPAEWNSIRLGTTDKSGSFNVAAFDSRSETFDTATTNIVAQGFERISDSEWRVFVAINVGVGASSMRAYIYAINDGRTDTVGDGTSGIYIWGAQLEQGSTPSSYIPTTTVQVTRAADNCSRTLGAEFNAAEGTLLWSGVPAEQNSNGQVVLGVSDGTEANQTLIRINGAEGRLQLISVRGGVISSLNTVGSFNPSEPLKVALSYSQSGWAAACNGVFLEEKTDVSGQVIATTAHLSNGPGSLQYTGTTESASYYPTRYSNAELQEVTAL